MDSAWRAQLHKGLVELAVLAALRQGEGYGYELLQRVNQQPALNVREPTVYPLLARLLKDGCLVERSGPSPHGPPRRYYRLTRAGLDRYRQMVRMWRAVSQDVEDLIDKGDPK
ncbi:MAG: PadR family transcriptional regulator [Candidatus Brocadiaceae bacterium]|nr:PadR family transcriptional regulator [Candidatus Brocadiaceae bacterium]